MSVSDFLFMKGTNFAISSCQIKLMYKDINYRSLSLNTKHNFIFPDMGTSILLYS